MTLAWTKTNRMINLKIAVVFFAVFTYAYLFISISYNKETLASLWRDNRNMPEQMMEQYLEKKAATSLAIKTDKITANFITKNKEETEGIINLNENNKPMEKVTFNINTTPLTLNTQLVRNQSQITEEIKENTTTNTLLVLFTTFDDNAEKDVCRNNTLKNWKSFGSLVKPVFFTDNDILAKRVHNKGWDVLPPSKTNIGIPVLKYMYLDVIKKYGATFYAYANGDILFVDNLVDTLQFILNSSIDKNHPMLIVGQRTNVNSVTSEQTSTHENILKIATKGNLFMTCAEDYFITNPNYPWKDIPDVVVGRVAYDNFLVLNAIKHNHTVIDATNTILAVHQTTKAGNLEGHHHKNKSFNTNLLRQLYKDINYGLGITQCTKMYTIYNITNSQIQVNRRTGC